MDREQEDQETYKQVGTGTLKKTWGIVRFVLPALAVCILFLLGACATYYDKTIDFQTNLVAGRYEEAAKVLNAQKTATRGNNKLLYFLQQGTVQHLRGDYESSNEFFENAYRTVDEVRKVSAQDAAALFLNPSVTPFKGEDFEVVLLHYYKTLNFLGLGQYENALVECRRLNIRLNELNDKYKKKKYLLYWNNLLDYLITLLVEYDAWVKAKRYVETGIE